MINVVTVDADGNERTVNMGDVKEAFDTAKPGDEIRVGDGDKWRAETTAEETVRLEAEERMTPKPKRARNRVATKTTITRTIEKELTFTEETLRRMLRIPEGATLKASETFEPLSLVATWVVTK